MDRAERRTETHGRRLGETQPMRTAEVRAGYAGYQKSLDRRREIVNTPRTPCEEQDGEAGAGEEKLAGQYYFHEEYGGGAVF